ncbi:hypothetical protein JCM10908_001004 [Rhodotorula pacifica]|uniref:uncharacterized protein n=1 Tax=Rhodotorula pacifica TaxID=1495444 RepID=UPI0031706D3F
MLKDPAGETVAEQPARGSVAQRAREPLVDLQQGRLAAAEQLDQKQERHMRRNVGETSDGGCEQNAGTVNVSDAAARRENTPLISPNALRSTTPYAHTPTPGPHWNSRPSRAAAPPAQRPKHLATRSLSDPISPSRLRLDDDDLHGHAAPAVAWGPGGREGPVPHVPLLCRVTLVSRTPPAPSPSPFTSRQKSSTPPPKHAPVPPPPQPQPENRQPFLLSRRYGRSVSDSWLSSRSPVQERSIPRFSSSSSVESSGGLSSSSARRRQQHQNQQQQRRSFSGLSAAQHRYPSGHLAGREALTSGEGSGAYDRLFEDLVLVTLEKRLADRLARARIAEPPSPSHASAPPSASPTPTSASTSKGREAATSKTPSLSSSTAAGSGSGSCRRAAVQAANAERASLGGIRPGREMWIWSAVRRTRECQQQKSREGGAIGIVPMRRSAAAPHPFDFAPSSAFCPSSHIQQHATPRTSLIPASDRPHFHAAPLSSYADRAPYSSDRSAYAARHASHD